MTLRKLYVLMLFSSFSCIGYCALEFYEDGEIVDGDDYSSVRVYSDAAVDVLGGNVDLLETNDTSMASIYAGSVGMLSARDFSTVNLFGGEIRQGFQVLDDTASINIYAQEHWTYVENGRIFLEGAWEDGGSFLFYFYRRTELPENVTIIPEPMSLLLLGSGFLLLRRKSQ